MCYRNTFFRAPFCWIGDQKQLTVAAQTRHSTTGYKASTSTALLLLSNDEETFTPRVFRRKYIMAFRLKAGDGDKKAAVGALVVLGASLAGALAFVYTRPADSKW